MNRLAKLSLVTVMVLFVAMIAFGSGVLFASSAPMAFAQGGLTTPAGTPDEIPEEFNTFWQAWSIVNERFVDQDELDPTELTYGAIEGMLKALGDEGHTAFLTAEELAYQRSDISGTFSGIGAYLGMKDGMHMIVSPMDGSPAKKAGVLAGDIIMAVDGEDTATWDTRDIVNNIRGPKSTEVVLTLLRIDGENSESLDITIVRDDIEVPAAEWGMIPGTDVGLLRLSQFSANATDNLKEAIAEAEEAGAEAFILDIRNNPGGLLDQAVKVTSQFLDGGNVLQEEDSNGKRKVYGVRKGGVATDIPLVVLISPGTASSAEILAGAVQDYERAQVIGETTFGTGTVLEPFMLDDGSALLLGTRQWLTAEGRLIRKQGITPDIEIDLPITADLITVGELEELTIDELLASEDLQMLEALKVLDALPESDSVIESETEVDADDAAVIESKK